MVSEATVYLPSRSVAAVATAVLPQDFLPMAVPVLAAVLAVPLRLSTTAVFLQKEIIQKVLSRKVSVAAVATAAMPVGQLRLAAPVLAVDGPVRSTQRTAALSRHKGLWQTVSLRKVSAAAAVMPGNHPED
ncbi:hypothetical protein B9H02_08925 [Prosthecochloris sp. HL-130-GSB]|nr:hypothetical protein B9H02_08925 [Prosthecochloris sp. HL-130-GSB]